MGTKIIANYLPQFHRIPENDLWWGEGYTDWVAAKNGKPLFEGHRQPRVPIEGYYDLSDKEAIKRQAKLANEYGIDGFGIYHYWFSSKQNLLIKPVEIILDNKDIDINYMFIWDNASWKQTWSKVKSFAHDWTSLYENDSNIRMNKNNGVLAELKYGDKEEWKRHFEFLLPHFKDERYIKVNGKPVFTIFHQTNKTHILCKMFSLWNKLAQEQGFPGIYIIGMSNAWDIHIADEEFNYQPPWDGWEDKTFYLKIKHKIFSKQREHYFDYDQIWGNIIANAQKNARKKVNFGAFVDFDDSPRRGENGTIVLGGTPEKFERYLERLLKISNDNNKKFIFLTAWNEWGEGAYLEPDADYEFTWLKAVKSAKEKYQR